MDLSPEQKAERCKRIVAACAALKRTILESPQISNVFRDIGQRLLRRMRINLPAEDSSQEADLLRLKRLMEMKEWTVELEGIRQKFLLGDEETREVFNLFEPTLERLRLVAVDTVTLKGGIFAWRTAEAFLLGWPTKRLAATKKNLPLGLELACEKWLPEIYLASRTKAPVRPSTGRDPLDKRNTMDPHNQVHTPYSGQTKKPGSRRDNRGHK